MTLALRTNDQWRFDAATYQACSTNAERTRHNQTSGVQWTPLLQIPYFDIVRRHSVDVIHCVAKHTMSIMLEVEDLGQQDLDEMADTLSTMQFPSGIPNFAPKVRLGFSRMTSADWQCWLCVVSPVLLRLAFLSECRCGCDWFVLERVRQSFPNPLSAQCMKISLSLQGVDHTYGREHSVPNLHMHLHLAEAIRDFGSPAKRGVLQTSASTGSSRTFEPTIDVSSFS